MLASLRGVHELRLARKVAVNEEAGEVALEGVCCWFKLRESELLRPTLSVDQADRLVEAEAFELPEKR